MSILPLNRLGNSTRPWALLSEFRDAHLHSFCNSVLLCTTPSNNCLHKQLVTEYIFTGFQLFIVTLIFPYCWQTELSVHPFLSKQCRNRDFIYALSHRSGPGWPFDPWLFSIPYLVLLFSDLTMSISVLANVLVCPFHGIMPTVCWPNLIPKLFPLRRGRAWEWG